MAAGGAAGAGAAAAAAAIAQATKASGAIVKLEPNEFQKILNRAEKPVVVVTYGGFLSKSYKYLTSYRGLFFFTKSSNPLLMPSAAETVAAESIWIP
ncbi:hypothetical protein GF377_10755 [candidate division GN15 bacterium]|nr:hypothetical protein [candidate division GN15 bacterium]